MFYFRINRLKIVDNREARHLFRLFGTDRAEVKLCSFIATDETQLPEIDEFMRSDDSGEKRDLLAAAVARVVDARVLTTIQNVKDNHEMTFGDTGYVLYRAERIPEFFDWILLAVESDRDERELGRVMKSVIDLPDFDHFVADVALLAGRAANPSYAGAVAIGKFVTRGLSEQLRRNRDDMIGVLYTSLDRHEHYPHGERKRDHVADLTNNMFVDYSLFGVEADGPPAAIRRLPPTGARIHPRRVSGPRQRRAL